VNFVTSLLARHLLDGNSPTPVCPVSLSQHIISNVLSGLVVSTVVILCAQSSLTLLSSL